MRLFIFSCFLLFIVGGGCKDESDKEQSEVPVDILVVKERSIIHQALFSGTLEAHTSYELAFMVPGEVTSVTIDEGQKVEKGQPLATLEKNEYRKAYEAAEARVEQATDQYKRLKNMYEANSLTKGDFMEITSKKKEAEAKLAEYRKKLDRTVLKAPASGLIERVSVSEGEVVKEGVPVITMVQSDQLFATFSIPESSIASIKVGDSCVVSFEEVDIAAPKQQTVISKIEPVANPLSRSFKAYATIDNKSGHLRPGMLARIRIDSKESSDGIVITPDLLVHRNNTLNLWMVTNGRATLKRVLVGELTADKIQITKGIQPGDTLITGGGINLREGEAIKVME